MNNLPPQPQPFVAMATTEQLIMYLRDPDSNNREQVLIQLSNVIRQRGEMCIDLGWQLWNSNRTVFPLLQEVTAVYPKFLTSTLTMMESARVCNALSVFKCMASHPDARIWLVKANIPYYLFSYLQISQNAMNSLEFVRRSSLDLISALAKFDEPYGQDILHRLLQTEEVFSLCLHCIHHGDILTRKVATLILMKILMQERGLIYCCDSPDRFVLVVQVLRQLVETFYVEIPCVQQLKYVVQCFLSLSQVPWLGWAYATVKSLFPTQLINNTFHIIIHQDPEIPNMLHQIRLNLIWDYHNCLEEWSDACIDYSRYR